VIGDPARAKGLIHFLGQSRRLKLTPRTGWLDRGVPAEETESIAHQCFQTALLAWLAAASDPTLDRDRILKLAIVHDLPEALTGDKTPYDRDGMPDSGADRAAWRAFLDRRHVRSTESRQAKRAAESEAMETLLADLRGNARVELAALWHELNEGLSIEARFVKQADKLEAYLQSLAYRAENATRPMDSFAKEVDEVVTHPALVSIRDAARDQ
jgi:5'-deoxynucleotidase